MHFRGPEVVATSCRSLLLYSRINDTSQGTLYRTKENVLVLLDGVKQVIEITDFFSVPSGNEYHTFVKGTLFIVSNDREIHKESGNYFVAPTTCELISEANKILQKVMLYPDPDNLDSPNFYIVIDFNRPHLPIRANDVIVPIYPKVDDMLQVAGENDEVWFGRVMSVDVASIENVEYDFTLMMQSILLDTNQK